MRKIDLKNFQVATSETARDINRRIVLNFLRTHQPISRADLARKSGLQFSTVSLIVEELIEQQWVTEGALTDAPRGRKPRVLHFNNDRTYIIGVDIRPVHTTLAVADMSGRFVTLERLKTINDPEKFIDDLTKAVGAFMKSHKYTYAGIGVSLPGRVTLKGARLAYAPNLGWRDIDFIGPLEETTGLPVIVENAPNACALAEIWFGKHADGVQDLVALTVSEGVGCGIFMNGQLLRGPTGMAGEFGHVSICEDGLLCNCGNRGCWEVYASNSAAVRYYEELSAPGGKKNGQGTTGRNGAISFEDIVNLAEQNDTRAVKALEKMGHYLGVGLAMVVTSLAPSVVVVVGEVTRAWNIVGPPVLKEVASRVQKHLPTKIVPTDDLIHPRLRGAVAVILHNDLGAPLVA
ncbi:MAG: ROK family transcriptional regulator [Candidatus Sumerlaeaceae bacterium]